VKEADAQANEAFDKALKHARNDTHLEHQIKLSKGYAELKKLLQGYVKDSSKKPRGPAEYSFKAALVGVGAKFLTHHGGNVDNRQWDGCNGQFCRRCFFRRAIVSRGE